MSDDYKMYKGLSRCQRAQLHYDQILRDRPLTESEKYLMGVILDLQMKIVNIEENLVQVLKSIQEATTDELP